MKEKLSLIIVAGANASGKTTLIDKNTDYLLSNNFEIIIPDRILKYATSLTDRPAVIGEYIDDAIAAKKNILIETPFQNQEFMSRVQEIIKLGYETTLYQLYLSDPDESVARVQDRFKKGGMYISNQEVVHNYHANFKSVANIFQKFNHSFFVDNAEEVNYRLTAQFKAANLVMFKATDNSYLKELFKESFKNKFISVSDLKTIAANKDYVAKQQAQQKSKLKF